MFLLYYSFPPSLNVLKKNAELVTYTWKKYQKYSLLLTILKCEKELTHRLLYYYINSVVLVIRQWIMLAYSCPTLWK